MRRAISVTLILVLAVCTMVAPEAGAGWWDKWKNKDKDEAKNSQSVPRYDVFPTMTFHKGVLGRGVGLGWQLDEINLQFKPDCVITSDLDGETGLAEGHEALVMGSRFGDTIIAFRVRLIKPDYMLNNSSESSQFTPSEVDPTVGVGTGPQ